MRKLLIPILVLLSIAILMSLFVIKEGERGIVLRFGRVLEDSTGASAIHAPGLHFKMPLFDSIKILDARIQTMDGKADRFVTLEQKDVIIDTYVKWKIKDFERYYLTTGGGNISTAQTLLERKVTDVLRAQIGSYPIVQIVSGPITEEMELPEIVKENEELNTKAVRQALEVDGQRDVIMNTVLEETRISSMEDLGIEVVDFRMKQINLPDEISDSIYLRMRAEREAVARAQRSQGRERAEFIRAKADLDAATILAEADRTARVTKGDADAVAADIYAKSYKKSTRIFQLHPLIGCIRRIIQQ